MTGRRKNGKGTLRERSDGRWEARLVVNYDSKGNPITKSVYAKTRAECLEKFEKLKEETVLIGGKLPKQAKPGMPFGEWMDIWYRGYCKPGIRDTTAMNYEHRIYSHIIPQLGHIPLNKLTQADLQAFYNRLKTTGRLNNTELYGEGLSDRMVRSCHTTCRAALEKAVVERMIPSNPAKGCKLPPKKAREMQVLTSDEIQRFLKQAKFDGYYDIFLVELSTGLRRGELLGLKWEDFNVDTGELSIRRQVVKTKDGYGTNVPKTKGSVRTIQLPPQLIRVLSKRKDDAISEWIFPSTRNPDKPFNPSTIYRVEQKLLERADCKKIRFHDLRHTFATMSLANGMDIKTLSAIIGHESSATTLDIYSHITTEMQISAAKKIDAGYGREQEKVDDNDVDEIQRQPTDKDWKPTPGKIRKPGTGCISKINEHLYEGRYSPTNARGKRETHNIYAKTREDCEIMLAALIEDVRAKIDAEKEKMKK